MMDKYTKTVLTVIAVALCAIAVQQAISLSSAQNGFACGGSPSTPCYVQPPRNVFDVFVVNLPSK